MKKMSFVGSNYNLQFVAFFDHIWPISLIVSLVTLCYVKIRGSVTLKVPAMTTKSPAKDEQLLTKKCHKHTHSGKSQRVNHYSDSGSGGWASWLLVMWCHL